MVQAGVMDLLLKEVKWRINDSRGTRYIGVVVEQFDKDGVSNGELAGELYWTDATKARTVKALKAAGWACKFDPNDPDTFLGPWKVVKGSIKNDEYPKGSGEFKLKLDWLGESPFGTSLNEKHKVSLAEAKQLQAEVLAAMGGAPQF